MIRKLDKVRAGRATKTETLLRSVDKYWFRFLGVVHRWAVRRGQAHGRREKVRRFRRHLAWQNHHLN